MFHVKQHSSYNEIVGYLPFLNRAQFWILNVVYLSMEQMVD